MKPAAKLTSALALSLSLSLSLAFLLPSVCRAQPQHTPQSAACGQALEALQAHESTRHGASAPDAQWQTLRRNAARTCLGGTGDAQPTGQRQLQAPISITTPPTAGGRPAAMGGQPALSRPATRPLLSVTSCDALGCWASDGSRLTRLGADLVGPQGICTLQGTVLNCR